MAVKLIKHDLEFILEQIKVSEAHASGTPLSDLVSSPLLPTGVRTVDGSYNNFGAGREQWGASGQPFESITQGENFVIGSGGFAHPGYPTNNDYGQPGSVVDAEPRMISNLIVDQTLDNPAAISAALHHAGLSGPELNDIVSAISAQHQTVTSTNATTDPEAHAAAAAALDALLAEHGVKMDGPSVMLPNVAPDEGLSASYNSFFTLFGQFFDHGLDLVAKGGNETVYMPLSPDDPLYNPDSPHTNFMVMTRATVGEGAANVTTPWVDQNQTYTSNPSHQVFVREYVVVDGVPVATGRLLNGEDGHGLATWADVKEQARTVLGIELTDLDVTSVPVVAVDPYGNFIPGTNGLPQLVVGFEDGTPVLLEGNLDTPVNPSAENAARAGVAFLDDIAHAAAPVAVEGVLQSDGDSAVGYSGGFGARGAQTHYDNELLDAHYITGDGRGNENVGLTAIHHVFHSEHNRMVEHVKEVVLQSGDLDFLNDWLSGADITEWPSDSASLSWDGERLFQAARFSTEMQYQHLVFEEFARKIQPDIDVFMVQPDAELNPVIFSEFANVVYRFGHSMLNETVDRINPDGTRDDMSLFEAFLNPLAFGSDTVDHAQAAGAIIRGMTAQVGNEIDEFVTDTLRNQLLGIPLDLPAINIARGRDTGMPSLNEARAQFSEMAGSDSQLTPYESWTDFALNMKNPASVVNFIAAYGDHDALAAETTLAGKRAVATSIVLGIEVELAGPAVAAEGQIWTGPNTAGSDDANPLVDDIYYNALYPDVQAAGVDPDTHYAQSGWTEGRDPNEFFSTAYYLETYPDIAAAGINPLEHYAQLGFAEGRNPSANFDGSRYLAEHELPEGTNPLVHFLTIGRYEGLEYFPVSAASTERTITPPADRLEFLNGPAEDTGLNDVDLWMGGLAEKKMPFGGMLGSTFAFVFEMQLENLQDADRFYYLSRVQGLNLLTELENNSLAKMVLANTDLGETGFALPADIFSVPDHILYLDHAKQMQMTGIDDPEHDDPTLEAISQLVQRGDGFIRYNGVNHLVMQGTDGNDHIIAGGGDDAVWGGAGNDRLEAGYGVDQVIGGDGDDIITNSGTDIGATDVLKGEDGNDVIHGGSGLSLIFGGAGKDFLMTGPDGLDVRAGTGDDFIQGGDGSEFLFGNAGDDWIEAQQRFDYIAGDNGELFFNSTEIGHDVLNGGAGDTDYDADSGDDIMFAGEGIQKNIGMWGHDWVIHKGQQVGADADMNVEVFTTLPLEVLRDRFSQVESLSGWENDDILRGDNRSDEEQAVGEVADPTPEGNFLNNELDEAGITRISGLDKIVTSDLLKVVAYGADGSGDEKLAFTGGNILLGGGGSDLIEGRGGDDLIDGDAWLNVRISIRQNLDGTGGEIASVDGMKGNVTLNGVTKPLTAWMLSGAINPGQLQIVREILHDDSGTDTALYWAERDAYDVGVDDVTGRITVAHVDVDAAAVDPISGKNRVSDGTDKLTNIEVIAFDDMNLKVVMGNNGNGRLDGAGGNDMIIGLAGNDNLFGHAGDDALYGGEGVDRLAGDAGNDLLDGGAGNDNLLGGDGDDVLLGGAGNDALSGQNGNDTLDGGAGNDSVLGGAGDDSLIWNVGGGRDMMNGQIGTDTALILGAADEAENFIIYDRVNAAAQGFVLATNTEIAIIRNGTLIAELDNIEEIVIDGQGGGDSFSAVGTFTGTSLAMSTITVIGSEDDDSVDLSALTSAHRVVFKSNGGNDTVIGPMREQDSVEDVGDGQVNFVDTGPEQGHPTDQDGGNLEGDVPDQDNDYAADDDNPSEDQDHTDGDAVEDNVTEGREVLIGTDAADSLIGGTARDMIFGGNGNDIVVAGAGADMVFGDSGHDRIFAEAGNDYVNAGSGNDAVFGGSGDDTFVAETGDGNDVYYGDDIEGGSGIDTLDMSAITVNISADLGSGFMGRGSVSSAQTGNDTIWGIENIVTGSGNDDIRASASVNVMDGGAGNDIFRFGSAADADGDIIMGFQPGDVIDLSEIDADDRMGGDQVFTLMSKGFSGRGELMVTHEAREDGAYTVVEGNISGNKDADFEISIKGTHQLNENHFSL